MSKGLFHRLASMVLVGALLTAGCANNANMPPGAAPDIPPASTFVIDLEPFAEDSSSGKTQIAQQMLPGSHWTWAAGNLAFWNAALTVTLIVPVGTFLESFNHDPMFVDGGWEWCYSVLVGGVNYTARLRAEVSWMGVYWDMFLSRAGGFTNVNWFSGFSNLAGTEGTWTLNRDPNEVQPFILIEWNRNTDGTSSDIRYTNITEGAAQNGSYIFAAFTESAELDADYSVYNVETDNLVDIAWNRETVAGRVMDEGHFGDADWRCWDDGLQNVECEGEE